MKNSTLICILFFCSLFSACGNLRPLNDDENEKITGVRTMLGHTICLTGSGCLKSAIEAAKEDCAKTGKHYEYHSHDIGISTSVKYKCIDK